jgi:hypothetical protein
MSDPEPCRDTTRTRKISDIDLPGHPSDSKDLPDQMHLFDLEQEDG